jgi:DNA-binding IclR family transcriptional regulator
VHRLLARLVELGAIEPHGAGYKIGLELFQMGSVTPAYAMRDTAMPYLAAVHRWTGHLVSLAVLRQPLCDSHTTADRDDIGAGRETRTITSEHERAS